MFNSLTLYHNILLGTAPHRIARMVRQPRGNALLVGVGGTGKQSLTRLAAHMCGYKCFQIEISRGYDYTTFHEDLKKLYKMAGVENQDSVFLFTDTQVRPGGTMVWGPSVMTYVCSVQCIGQHGHTAPFMCTSQLWYSVISSFANAIKYCSKKSSNGCGCQWMLLCFPSCMLSHLCIILLLCWTSPPPPPPPPDCSGRVSGGH